PTRVAGPRTLTWTRAETGAQPAKPEAAVVTGTPANTRWASAATSPTSRTSRGVMRTTPRAWVSRATVRYTGPGTLAICVGWVVTDSTPARLFGGPMRRAVGGTTVIPSSANRETVTGGPHGPMAQCSLA